MTYALIDADMILHHAIGAAQQEVQWDDDIWVQWCGLREARDTYYSMLATLGEAAGFGLDDCWHCFTSRSQFRRDLFPGYKAKRKGSKPIGYGALKAEILASDHAFMYDQIEADDVISLLSDRLEEADYVIVSGDKDLRQIEGPHCNLTGEVEYVSPLDACYNFWIQAVMGDPVDGIPGAKGIGKVKAERIARNMDLTDPVDCWRHVLAAYGDADEALLNARLVRLLRHDEYDFNNHTVKLWEPPTLHRSSLLAAS